MMKPRMLIVLGRMFSESVSETESFDKLKGYLEAIGNLVRDNDH